MSELPIGPAAYEVELTRDGAGLTKVAFVLAATGEEVAVYDGVDPVNALIEGAQQRERGAPDGKLPSDEALIEEFLWDCGLVEDDAEGEVARVLDAQAGEPDCSGIEGAVPNQIRPEIQRVLDGLSAPRISQEAARDMLVAGRAVVRAWEGGDLAAAVRALAAAVTKAGGGANG